MSPLNLESWIRDNISLGLNFGISNLINQDQELTSIFFEKSGIGISQFKMYWKHIALSEPESQKVKRLLINFFRVLIYRD